MTMPTPTALRTTAGALAIALLLPGSGARAETADIKVPKVVVSTAFNAALASMKIKLDNYGAKHGTSWLDQQSTIVMPGGGIKKFSLPESEFDIGDYRKLKHYIDDLTTSQLSAAVAGDRIMLSIAFESQGEEVKGKCVRRLFGKWGECSLDMERDVHLDNSRIEMSVVPVAYKGSVSIGSPQVSFKTDIKIASKLCQAFSGICGKIENRIKGEITKGIEGAALAQLKSAGVRDAVANGVRSAVPFKSLIDPKWTVKSVKSQGSDFVVTVERPDTIDEDNVSALSLKPVVPTQTTACPANVKLAATIKMKHAVAGTGQLSYEDGSKSNVFNWQAKKGQTVTSVVSRTVKGQPGKTTKGTAVMKLSWKGADGKTYSRASNVAKFSVTCSKAAGGGIALKK
jgi:hypothetical protein